MLKIKYIKNRFTHNLTFGVLMVIIGLFAVFENPLSFYTYLWIAFGALHLVTVIFEKRNQYITIENNKLIKHSIIKKSIDIKDIRKIRKNVSSYKIETSGKTLKINKDIIEAESLYKLDDYFKKLNIKA